MTNRRWTVAGLLAATLLTLGVSACNSAANEPGATKSEAPAIPADPKQALLDSTKEISKGHFKFTMAGDGTTGGGVVHLPTRSAQISMSFASADFEMKMDIIYAEPESWVKMDFGDMGKMPGMEKLSSGKYLHLDQSKVKDIEDLKFDFQDVDPAGSSLLTKAIVDVQKTGEGLYSGTVDLTKATEAGLVDEETIKALGTQANALPFEAKLDPQGRLTELTVKVPAVGDTKAHELKVIYSEYGTATAPQKPAASETEEAPTEAYDMFK